MNVLPIRVSADYEGRKVTGLLTGNGSGRYTGLLVNGKVIAVLKSTVKHEEQL
jgi:hypothetical protein